MRIRAAVLEEFGEPLVVQELDLAEPKEGEVLVRLGACGVCHTDLYTASGVIRPDTRPACSGTKVPASSSATARASRSSRQATTSSRCSRPSAARASTAVAVGRTAASLFARRRVTVSARRHDTPFPRRRADASLHGHLDVRRVHGDAGDRAREGLAGGVARGVRAVRLRLATGMGAALCTADVQTGSTCVVFGCGLVGLGAVIGCRLSGAERIIAIDLSEGRLRWPATTAPPTRGRRRRHRRLDPRGDRRL